MNQDASETRDRAEEERSHRLDRAAAAVSEDASCVGQWQVGRLCADAGPDVTAAEVRKALERWGVRVADLPRLPAKPPSVIARHPGYADAIARLGRKLSIELVFGDGIKDGFSLLHGIRLDDGRPFDREAIEKALQRTPPAAHREDWKRVLSVLSDAAQEPWILDDIVFWEVAEALRPLTRLGYSQRAVTEQAVRFSLMRDEAELLAAAVAEEYQVLESPHPATGLQVEQDSAVVDRAPRADLPDEPSHPVSGPVTPELLQPVTDLQVRSIRGRTDLVQLSWSPPPGGLVTLRTTGEPAQWPPGSTIARSDADSYGQPLNVPGVPGPDRRMTCEVRLPQTRTFVTALTVGEVQAAVGRTVELTRDAPVRDLSYLRRGAEVLLTWTWPDEAASAYVAWQPLTEVEEQHGSSARREQLRCSRRAYEAEGGFTTVMGHAAQRVEVWAVIKANGEEYVTAPAEIEMPATGAPVHYDFLPVPGLLSGVLSRVGRHRQRELRLLAELPCVLPDLVVVQCRHLTIPLSPHDNEEIVDRIPGGPIDPDTPLRKVIRPDGVGPSWIVCFPDPAKPAAARTQVTLYAPPVGRQRW